MCRVIQVSRSGFYRWMKIRLGHGKPYERYLLFRIREVFEQNKGVYGSRRIAAKLRSCGVKCYQNQIAKIMKRHGIKARTKRKYRVTTESNHGRKVSPNLLKRDFIADSINRVWVGDITHIWTKEGWLYLSTVIDLCSRRVVGWSLSNRLTKELVISSLTNAIKLRNPLKGMIFHSDRGAQYASEEYRKLLALIGARQSMSRKGNCWDNAVAESFFKTLKIELIYQYNFKSRKEAELKIFEYIEMFYNSKRLHSAIDYMSPNDFEKHKLA